MHIVIGCGAMSFGPRTPMVKSLGGSETAALELSKALARKGHDVHLFCHLPVPPAPDAFPPLGVDEGVTYHDVMTFGKYVNDVEHDLLIGVRDPQFVCFEAKCKKKVLWAHDIFTKKGMQRALDQMGWTFDEIWTVSEWHKKQINEATGYPLENIVALRNGCVKYDDVQTLYRAPKHLIYCARPERGLDNLIKPGGIMEHLPEFKLTVAMYEHFPAHMKDYYDMIFKRMKEMPNVEFVGGKPNHELRQMIADSEAYIYPTQFEETSCIVARECMEQGTPFITTRTGALEETLGDCGIFFEDWLKAHKIAEPEKGSTGWCKLFAMFFRDAVTNPKIITDVQERSFKRTDLHWDGVADIVEAHAEPYLGPYTKDPAHQTIGAAVIAMNNQDTIRNMLDSLVGNVDEIHIALGPCTDRTTTIIGEFANDHPEIPVVIIAAPKIEARVFGFDDARNLSVSRLKTDWILWIDTDEYLVTKLPLKRYARNNHLQAYLINQHHFSVEPRGAAPQIDKPARLFRNGVGFKARGHIHEHFEVPEGGPGRAFLLQDVDIAHTGYKDEAVRKTRFERNLPFLQWEHESGSDRKLNHFLWLRDLIHVMREAAKAEDRETAVRLAHDAISYYNKHYVDMAAFGPGIFMALQYFSEANAVLGKGFPMKVTVQLEDRQASFEGLFTEYGQIERVLKQMLEPEFADRTSRYYG